MKEEELYFNRIGVLIRRERHGMWEHREKAMWEYNEVAFCKPERSQDKANLYVSWFETSNFQNCEKTNFCSLSLALCYGGLADD